MKLEFLLFVWLTCAGGLDPLKRCAKNVAGAGTDKVLEQLRKEIPLMIAEVMGEVRKQLFGTKETETSEGITGLLEEIEDQILGDLKNNLADLNENLGQTGLKGELNGMKETLGGLDTHLSELGGSLQSLSSLGMLNVNLEKLIVGLNSLHADLEKNEYPDGKNC